MRDSRHSAGISVGELLVVLSIVAVILALLLPAILMVRSTSRSFKCSNNLRQIALAVANYDSVFKQLPHPFVSTGHGSLVALLPYLEQEAIYRKCDLTDNVFGFGNKNEAARNTPVPLFHCPSSLSQTAIRTDYLMNKGSLLDGSDSPWCYGSDSKSRSIAGLPNGSSNTMLFSEFGYSASATNRRFAALPRSDVTSRESEDSFVSSCKIAVGSRSPGYRAGESWIEGSSSHFHTIIGPNGNSCLNGHPDDPGGFSAQGSIVTASSFHANAVNVAFADGHVSAVSDSVNLKLWRTTDE